LWKKDDGKGQLIAFTSMSECIKPPRLSHYPLCRSGPEVRSYASHGAAQEKLSFDPSDEVAYRYERAIRVVEGHAGKSNAESKSGTIGESAHNRFKIRKTHGNRVDKSDVRLDWVTWRPPRKVVTRLDR
jgi:hypothetical protein